MQLLTKLKMGMGWYQVFKIKTNFRKQTKLYITIKNKMGYPHLLFL